MIMGTIYVVAFLLVLFMITAALQSNRIEVRRELLMSAKPEEIFEQVNDFRNWEKWSPWAQMYPNATVVYDGPTSGEGAMMSWHCHTKPADGKMTITESVPARYILIRTEFRKPLKAMETMEFSFDRQGDQTLVTWSLMGSYNYVGKVVGMFMDYDHTVGNHFVKGLALLKHTVEDRTLAAA